MPWAPTLAHLLGLGRPLDWLANAARLTWHELRGRGAPPWPIGAAAIDYLAVDEAHRGSGVGTALVTAALAAHPALAWAVTTTADNAVALSLYRRHGFISRERWRGYDGREYVRLHRPAETSAAA